YLQLQHALTPGDPLTLRVEKYQSLKQTMANFALSPPKGLASDKIAEQMSQWRKQANELESELNRTLNAKKAIASGEEVAAAGVQKRLRPDECLVEFVRAHLRDYAKPAYW